MPTITGVFMTEKSWIDIMESKHDASYSNVCVVVSNDNRRFLELRNYLDEKGRKMLILDMYAGLVKRERKQDGPVGKQKEGLSGLINTGPTPIDEINRMLTQPDEKADEEACAIVKNILEQKDVPMNAVNLWTTDENTLGGGRMLILFVPDKGVIDSRVLDKCIVVTPPLSLPRERKKLLENQCKKVWGGLELVPEQVENLVNMTSGLDLNQTEALYFETLRNLKVNKALDIGLVAKAKADIIEKDGMLKVISEQRYGFEGVGGYEVVKDYIIESIVKPLKDPERAKALGVDPPRGAIIFGPPGTGKTIIAKACARELSFPLVMLSPEMFLNKYVGESERRLGKIFQILEEMAPVMVLIDEMDGLGGRESNGNDVQQKIFTQFLRYAGDEDRKAFLVGTTNSPMMDEAFRREGRFDVMIPMMSPDTEARLAILLVHLNKRRQVKHKITEAKLVEVAAATEGWKGNMLEELVKRSARLAFNLGKDYVTDEVLQMALDDYRVNKETLLSTETKYMELADQLCNSEKFLKALKKTTVSEETGRETFMKRKSKGL